MPELAATKLRTRPPTGKPAWPFIVLAGVQSGGKSYQAALATGSARVGQAFMFEFGESQQDMLAAIPGARFHMVELTGRFNDLLEQVLEASKIDWVDGKPNLLVLDSVSKVWQLLCDEAQWTANKRVADKIAYASRQGREYRGRAADPVTNDYDISSDLWNRATMRWDKLIAALQKFPGIVIATARLDEVSVFDAQGNITRDKMWKMQAQKRFPFEVDVIIEIREPRGVPIVTKVRSLAYDVPMNSAEKFDGFTADALLERMQLTVENTGPRVIVIPDAEEKDDAHPDDWPATIEEFFKIVEAAGNAKDTARLTHLWKLARQHESAQGQEYAAEWGRYVAGVQRDEEAERARMQAEADRIAAEPDRPDFGDTPPPAGRPVNDPRARARTGAPA